MCRWHTPDCSTPDVSVTDAGIPTCHACGRTPDLAAILAQHAHEDPFPAPPPDQPLGQMTLWWPRSVPYIDPDQDLPSAPTTGHHPVSSPLSPAPLADNYTDNNNTIYPSPPPADSFRLLTLPAAPSPTSPLHLTLAIHPLDNCPPYEPASYCWFADDDDDDDNGNKGTPKQTPVYVGPFWDVLLLAANCAALLRFLRPASGERVVWVDAVCINQGSLAERAEQVRNMGAIYQGGVQTVVFLGADAVEELPPGRYARRARLAEFGEEKWKGPGGVEELLARRYFGRLWVVQELVLSPRVVVRVGDVDFMSDGATSGRLWSDGNDREGPTARAPWVLRTARGRPLDFSVTEVMWLTFPTECADPRDRLFGVMGMISDTECQADLAPDYSLPVQHVYFGLFAYVLVVRGMGSLLSFGSGPSNTPSVPSWVPDWTCWDVTLRDLFEPDHGHIMYRRIAHHIFRVFQTLPPADFGEAITLRLPLRYHDSPGAGLSVAPHTGALTASMVRLVALGSAPQFVAEIPVSGHSLYVARCGEHKIYLASRRRLDVVVQPGNDHLYLYPLVKSWPYPCVCILRRDEAKGRRSFRLVTSCQVPIFGLAAASNQDDGNEGSGKSPLNSLYAWISRHMLRRPPDQFQQADLCWSDEPCVESVYWTLSDVISTARGWMDLALDLNEQLLFPSKHGLRHRELQHVYLAVADGQAAALGAYRELVAKHSLPIAFEQDAIAIAIPASEARGLCREHREGLQPDLWGNVVAALRNGWGTSKVQLRSVQADPLTVVVNNDFVYHELRKSPGVEVLKMVIAAALATGEPEEQLLSRAPTAADRLVKVPTSRYARRLMEECGCDWSIETVQIV